MSAKGDPKEARPGRRVRFDRSQEGMAMPKPLPMPGAAISGGASGRRFVTAAVLAILLLWGSLYLIFRNWRAGYREREAFGARYVAGAVDALASIVPAGECPPSIRTSGCAGAVAIAAAVAAQAKLPDTSADAWHRAVAETHAMLITLTASNVLDIQQMNDLSKRVSALVAGARPSTARAELAALWDEIEAQAGPIVRSRHTRPNLLPPFPRLARSGSADGR